MKTGSVKFGSHNFNVEIAETLIEKAKGLMGREELPDLYGMLFIFSFESFYPFTMRGMKIPIDIIWLNRKEEIVYISEFLKPCRTLFCPAINPWKKTKYVLEVNAGTAKKLGLKIGDRAEIILPS